MIAYPDTSFLCASYRLQDNSAEAAAYFDKIQEPLSVTSLLLYEFRQSARHQVFRFSNDRTKGYPIRIAQKMLADLQSDIDAGILRIVAVDWSSVHQLAEKMSAKHTIEHGHRTLDVMHVATAAYLEATEFLTFDANQSRLAKAAGLKVKP